MNSNVECRRKKVSISSVLVQRKLLPSTAIVFGLFLIAFQVHFNCCEMCSTMSGDQLLNNQRPLCCWHPPWTLHQAKPCSPQGQLCNNSWHNWLLKPLSVILFIYLFFPRRINTAGQQPPVHTAPVSLVYVNTNVNTHTHVNALLNSSIKSLQCAGAEAAVIN